MARNVRLLYHASSAGHEYVPGDVITLSDTDAARLVFAFRAVYTDGLPTPPRDTDPFPRYVEITDLGDEDTPAYQAILAIVGNAPGEGGGNGPAGKGIQSIARTSGTGAAGTTDTYTITYTDSTTSTFQVRNGANGSDGAKGDTGATGKGITTVARTSGTGAAGTVDTYTITFSDTTTTTFQVRNGADGTGGSGGGTVGPAGRGITSVARTSGDGSAGTLDTYTITYSDNGTSTFQVRNGANGAAGVAGRGITSIARTSGNGAAGTVDTYTITYSDATTSTFTVRNGANGSDGIGSAGPAGRGITSVARTTGDGSAGSLDTYTITFTDAATTTFTVRNGTNGTNGTNGGTGPAGRGISSIARTSGDGSAGTVDTYTITYSDGSTSTYTVRNGTNGAAAGSPTVETLPAGSTITVAKASGNWPARPTSRSDVVVIWKGADPSPNIVTTGAAGMRDGIDMRFVTP